MKEFKRDKFSVRVSEPELYVDNQARFRSGHMSHALAEFAPDSLIDFNSNCSPVLVSGHSTYGWIEYRISNDAGVTFSDAQVLPYSKKAFLDGLFNISTEKSVACDDGSVVVFCLRAFTTASEPYKYPPAAVVTPDGGKTWSEPVDVSEFKGRIYDACWHDGAVYALEFCNDAEADFVGNKPEHLYRIYVSRDRGQSFEELCTVPFASTQGRGYGAMQFDAQGRLHVYAYNINNERAMDHIISEDGGKTWGQSEACYVAKGIRNPQVALLDGVFILHGRGEKGHDFVLYTSEDGSKWDGGEYLALSDHSLGFCCCYYSNNIVLRDPAGGDRLLIQYSDRYEEARVNVRHMWVKIIH